jgi:hypothetical protein
MFPAGWLLHDLPRRGVGVGVGGDAGVLSASTRPLYSSWEATSTRKSRSARPRHSGSTAISASIRGRATASGATPSRAQPRSKSRPMTALAPGQLPQQPASSSFLSSQADFLDFQSGLFRWFPTHSRHWRSMGRRVRRQRCRPGILARR